MNERTNKCVYFNRDILLMKSTVGHKCIAFTAVGNKRYKILFMSEKQWLKWFCEAGGGAYLTKPGWSKPHTRSNPTNLALFRRKITLYRFNQGFILLQGAQMGAGGWPPPPRTSPPRAPLTLTTAEKISYILYRVLIKCDILSRTLLHVPQHITQSN